MDKNIVQGNLKRWYQKDKKSFMTYATLFDMHYERCLGRLVRLFKWDGLPFPPHELEVRAQLDGFAGVVYDSKRGIMTAWGGMSGPTQYADYFKKFTYAAPTAKGGTKVIGKNAVILRNTPLATSTAMWIARYADLYAHNDISLRLALVNTRYQDILKVSDESKRETVANWYKALFKGDLAVMVDETPITDFVEGRGNIEALDINKKEAPDFTKYTELENELDRSFYRALGVRWNKDKKSNLVAGEIEQDDMLLEFNMRDMLTTREEFADDYNKVFGGNASVSLVIPLEREVTVNDANANADDTGVSE